VNLTEQIFGKTAIQQIVNLMEQIFGKTANRRIVIKRIFKAPLG